MVGDNVTIGHRCVVHACTVKDNVRIGIGAVVLDGAVVEEWAQVGAGALVPPGKVVPAGWLVMGVPAKPVRKMSQEELDDIAPQRGRLRQPVAPRLPGPVRVMRHPVSTSRRATAPPGRGRARGGVGGHVGAPHVG